MPWMLPLGVRSAVLKSAWASSQITRRRRPVSRQRRAAALTEPIERQWSPPSMIGTTPSTSAVYIASCTTVFHATTSSRCR